MKINMNLYDRFMRIVIAASIIILYFTNIIKGGFGILLLVVAAILVITSLLRFCPLYAILGTGANKPQQ